MSAAGLCVPQQAVGVSEPQSVTAEAEDEYFVAELMNRVGFAGDSLKTLQGLLKAKLQRVQKGDLGYPQEEELSLLMKNYHQLIRKKFISCASIDTYSKNEPQHSLDLLSTYRKKNNRRALFLML